MAARWDPGHQPGFEWKLGGVDEAGRKHGPYRSWDQGGVLHAETTYEHDEIHGKNLNFHPDGTVSSEAEWVHGRLMNSAYFRSDHPTGEPFPHVAPAVWSVRYYTRDGRSNYTIRYFTRDGAECGPDGQPLPARPAGVSADARWFPDLRRWIDGEIARGSNARVGRWRWWSSEGVLRHEERRDERGEPVMIADHDPAGVLEQRITRGPEGEQRDTFFEDGALSTRRRADGRGREIYVASWARDGALERERERVYEGDQLASVTERGPGGARSFEARREGPGMACMLYAEDGATLAAAGLIRDGALAGTWRLFDPPGEVRRSAELAPLAIERGATGERLRLRLGEALYRLDAPALPPLEALAGADTEPWAELEGPDDDALEQLPQLLRALATSEPLVRRYALAAIAGAILHQGSTYPVTARALPYLARLAAHDAVERGPLLELVARIGAAALRHADGPDRGAAEATLAALAAAWPQLVAPLPSCAAGDRRRIFAIARLVPEAAAPSLVELARGDRDPATRACALELYTGDPGHALADVTPCLTDRDPLVRATAAMAIAYRHGPASPREVVAALAEGIRNGRDLAGRFAELPFAEHHVLAHLAGAAGAIGTPDARSLARALCHALGEVDPHSALAHGEGLLALAYGRGARPFAKRHVEILATLARSDRFWTFEAEAREVLERWNLPRRRDELAALVAELETSPDPEGLVHARMHGG